MVKNPASNDEPDVLGLELEKHQLNQSIIKKNPMSKSMRPKQFEKPKTRSTWFDKGGFCPNKQESASDLWQVQYFDQSIVMDTLQTA